MYLRRLLLAIWLFSLLGTAAELLLLEHVEGILQLIPLLLIALGGVVGVWYARRPGAASLRTFRAVLVLFALSGAAGLYLHYRGNVEFEKEMDPAIGGVALFREAMSGAFPALAPGAMVLLAMIGYALTIAWSASPSPSRSPFRGGGPPPD